MSKALSISGLHKTYGNGVQAVKGIDLDIEEGDFFALLGANGAGKSTTINIICSLTNKSEGEIKIFDHDLVSDMELAKAKIGLVPQEFNFNIFEPIREIIINQGGYYGIPRDVCTERANDLLKALGLWDKRHEQARNLSGGMKRRLMIARALVHNPRLLILDEPTAGVDIEIRRSMWEFIKKINAAGTTIILTTHYLEEAEKLCRNIAIIDKGEIIEHTSMKELLSRLDTETIVMNTKDPVKKLPVSEDFVVSKVDETTLEVTMHQSRSLNVIFHHFSKHNIRVSSIQNRSNRLEQLFMKLVDNNKNKGDTT
ncbi:MAG: ABC transporter [uncultured Thiotrichaceae bacterium]|uniref:ABC transporter n=1 Tax=uncultured Thiotrichaceae bacterium TaxID=298394 RepID=A0A6S6TIE9_9GAMM|nr:MAG: ABC transporter [uncultured Thiotrichaceae bacterium]